MRALPSELPHIDQGVGQILGEREEEQMIKEAEAILEKVKERKEQEEVTMEETELRKAIGMKGEEIGREGARWIMERWRKILNTEIQTLEKEDQQRRQERWKMKTTAGETYMPWARHTAAQGKVKRRSDMGIMALSKKGDQGREIVVGIEKDKIINEFTKQQWGTKRKAEIGNMKGKKWKKYRER
jgi:hypothetical protein